MIEPLDAGCYLVTYWHMSGRVADAVHWARESMDHYLYPRGRGYAHRENVFTAYSDFRFALRRDPHLPLRPEHALDYPFSGLVLEVVSAEAGVGQADLVAGLSRAIERPHLRASCSALVVAFTARDVPRSTVVPNVKPIPDAGSKVIMLWFLDADPRTCWSSFDAHHDIVGAAGGHLAFAAPFIPTVPGTDLYSDQLRTV